MTRPQRHRRTGTSFVLGGALPGVKPVHQEQMITPQRDTTRCLSQFSPLLKRGDNVNISRGLTRFRSSSLKTRKIPRAKAEIRSGRDSDYVKNQSSVQNEFSVNLYSV